MTKETAVDLLDNLIGMVDDNQGSDYDTALHMAINALEYHGKKYKHYKGRIYEVICEARHTEFPMELVIYRSVATGNIWARPRDMFYGYTEDGIKRYREVDG